MKQGVAGNYSWKYDGPFEIIQKLSAVSYRLWMPESYGIHPMLNIAHLEKYQPSPVEFGNWPTKSLNHADFDKLPEYEVEMIITDWRKKGRKGRYVVEYLTRFKGYNADSDEWLNSRQLRNAPKIVEVWHKKWKPLGSHSVWEIASLITDFYGILPASPIFPPKIVPWYIKVCHLFRFLHHHSNSFPFASTIFYHAYAILYPCSSLLFLLGSNAF